MPPDPPPKSSEDSGDLFIDPHLFGDSRPAAARSGETAKAPDKDEILQEMRAIEARLKQLSLALQDHPQPATVRVRVTQPTPEPPEAIVLSEPPAPVDKFPIRANRSVALDLIRKEEARPRVLPERARHSVLTNAPKKPAPHPPSAPSKEPDPPKQSVRATLAPVRKVLDRGIPIVSVTMLVVSLVALAFVLSQFFRRPASASPMDRKPPTVDWTKRLLAAEKLVTLFLRASTVEERRNFVRNPDRVEPLMKHWYLRNSSALQSAKVTGISSALESYPNPKIPNQSIVVKATLEDGGRVIAPVEWTDAGAVIEWESMVGYSQIALASLPSQSTDPKDPGVTLRVMATLTNPRDLNDATLPLRFKFQERDSTTAPLTGQWPANSEGAQEVVATLGSKPRNEPFPITVQALPKEDFLISGEVVFKSVVLGWREIEP